MSRFARRGGGPRAGSGRESGQALLELAIVTPILILLIMAVFQFAYVFESQMGLTNAVREAARRAAATTTSKPVWTGSGSLQSWVIEQLCGSTPGSCDTGLLHQNVQGFDGTRLVPANTPSVTFCTYTVGSVAQYQVNVSVQYRHPLFFGPIAFATDLVDGTPGNGAWDLSASAQMRLENIDDTGTFTGPGATC